MLDRFVKAIDFATKNFLLLSVVLLIVYSILGWEFTTYYLSAFDSSLQNFVQYTDIPSISAISLTVFAPTIASVVFAGLAYGTHRSFSVRWRIFSFFIAIVSYVGPVLYDYEHIDSTGFIIDEFIPIKGAYLVLTITAVVVSLFPRILSSIVFSLFSIAAISLLCTGVYAYGTGQRTKRASFPLYDVILKKDADERRSLIGAKLILSLSHHTFFYLGNRAIVVQTPDITQMTVRRPQIE